MKKPSSTPWSAFATGGSTNHTLHLPAIAQAAGILINWDDFDELSGAVPLLARVYPNGEADINHFHAAGGMGYVIKSLLDGGYLHADVQTIAGDTLADYASEPKLLEGSLDWTDCPSTSADTDILQDTKNPFSANGGLRTATGNLGRGVIKPQPLPLSIFKSVPLRVSSTTRMRFCRPLKTVISTWMLWWFCVIKVQNQMACRSCTS